MAIYLDRGDEFAVQVEVDVGEVGRRPSVYHHLVQHKLVCRRFYTASLLLLLAVVVVNRPNSRNVLISPSSECTADGIEG